MNFHLSCPGNAYLRMSEHYMWGAGRALPCMIVIHMWMVRFSSKRRIYDSCLPQAARSDVNIKIKSRIRKDRAIRKFKTTSGFSHNVHLKVGVFLVFFYLHLHLFHLI